MREPNASNTAQQKSDSVKPAPVKLDPLGNRTVPEEDGAVHGGEETKPGQMQGDEDISPNAPQREIEEMVEARCRRRIEARPRARTTGGD